MEALKIDSTFDFSLYIERELRESKFVPGPKTMKALEQFAIKCFKMGFQAGQLPENRPIDLKEISARNIGGQDVS